MNKLMMVATAAMVGAMVTGCATSGKDPMVEWQDGRFKAQEINAVKAEGKMPQVQDVLYKSLNNGNGLCAPLAVPIDAVSPVPAALYLKVVVGVDELMATQAGRNALTEYNKLAAGNPAEDEAPMTKEQILAKWEKDLAAAKEKNPEAKSKLDAIKEYQVYLKNANPDTLIPIINDIITVQIPAALENVQKTVQTVLDDAKSGKLKLEATGMELLGGLSNTGKDGAALGQQLADAGIGAKYWLQLAQSDSDAKKDLAKLDAILN